MRSLSVLLAQVLPVPGDPGRNLDAAVRLVRDGPPADLAVFPELAVPGYALDAASRLAVAPDDPCFAALRRACADRRTAVVIGFAETGADRPYDALLCLDEAGATAGVYRKTHLFGAERDAFAAGDRLGCVVLAGARVGPLVCFDLEFPEVARTLASEAPDLLVCSAAMSPADGEHRVAARARALDTRTPLVYVNRIGDEGGYRFVGESRVVAADGSVVAELGAEPATAVVRVPLRTTPDPDVDYRHHLRPELYRYR